MMEWVTWLQGFAEHNQFFSGVAGVSVVGGFLYWVRSLPQRIWNWIVWLGSIEVEVGNDSVLFDPIDRWLAARANSWHTRRFMVVTNSISRHNHPASPSIDDDDDDSVVNVHLAPGRGGHWIRQDRWLYRIRREVTNEAHTTGSRIRQTLYIRTPGWSRHRVMALLDAARAELVIKDSLCVFYRRGIYWTLIDRRRPRPISSLILRAGLIEDLIADIEAFRSRQDWYVEHGVPYRRGYLFIGGPGGGKSSTTAALAGHFKLPLYVLNLGSFLGDDSLMEAVGEAPAGCILSIEDIDATRAAVRRTGPDDKGSGITLSALLNCLDGAMAKEGRILIMTSNHPERIDPAIIRPGRIDKTVIFGPAGVDEAVRMFARFFPEEIEFSGVLSKRYRHVRAAAEIQDVCVANLNDPEKALAALIGPPRNEFEATDLGNNRYAV